MNTFGNTGAMCVASKRIYVNSTIYAPFRAAFVSAVAAFKVGDPEKDPDVMIGPVQNKPQFEKVKCFLEDVKKHGWAVALQGGVKEGKGLFMTPTIVDNPPEDSKIVQEEQFGMFARNTSVSFADRLCLPSIIINPLKDRDSIRPDLCYSYLIPFSRSHSPPSLVE